MTETEAQPVTDARPFRKRRPVLFWALLVVGGLVLLSIVGNCAGGANGSTTAAVTTTVTASGPTVTVTQGSSVKAITVTRTVTESAQAQDTGSADAGGITDGTYEVGVDIAPGKYKTAGSDDTNPVGCYVAVLNSSDSGDIKTNNITKGPQTVVVRKGQYLDVSGCKPMTRVG